MNINDYHIIMPGHIIEYFPATQTATVRISNDRQFESSGESDVQMPYGLLYDVPTFTSGGGGWHVTFPIKPGDPCLLNFSQFGYDHWFVDNEDSAGIRDDGHPQPWVGRRFDLADGFVQVGWNNLQTAIANYKANDAEFRNADSAQRVSLKEEGDVEIVTGTTSIVLSNTGTITVNSDTSVTVTSPTVDINASTGVNIVSPAVTMSGTLQVTGAIGGGGAAPSSGLSMTGGGVFSSDVTASGTSLTGHTHAENGDGGGETSPPS